ncbi:hypothetical protein EDF82_1701 [Raoultella sp. BIGb0399]|uniref:hypothetical protein n=1 Tax=Raoultella sp. BIGb0399 TaxID=2485119 RepID=UPI000F4C2F8C|nr:hypothetical protein [Raoultella sp. BIGb0399]ROS16556.1 hypothetical protein EDF82_1701 [Raoultella sp. BIGb0399]
MKRRDLIKLTLAAIYFNTSFKAFASVYITDENNNVDKDKSQKSDLVVVDFISDMIKLGNISNGQSIMVKNHSSGLPYDTPAVFTAITDDKFVKENAGTCFSGVTGVKFIRKTSSPLEVNWFGVTDRNIKIKDLVSESDKEILRIIKSVTGEEYSDGDYLNNLAFAAAFKAAGDAQRVVLGNNKKYMVNKPVDCYSCLNVDFQNSTLKADVDMPAGSYVLSIGKQLYSVKGEGLYLEQGSAKLLFSEQVKKSNFKPGDLISLKSTDVRNGEQFKNIRPYYHGMRAVIKEVGDSYLIIDRPAYSSFKISEIIVHKGSNSTSLLNANIDLQASQKVMPPLSGVKLTGTNINIDNVKVLGNEFCGAGLLVLGCKSRVVNTFVSGFCNVQGLPLPGRVGYGIYVDCSDTRVEQSHFESNKHHVTCASRDFVMSDITIRDCTATTSDKDIHNDVNASFDLHSNVIGKVELHDLKITTKGPAFNIRNGHATITDCVISSSRYNKNTPALINVFEYKDVSNISFERNKIYCGENIRLFHFGEMSKIENISIINNSGSVAGIFDADVMGCDINSINISGNRFKKMKFLLNLNSKNKNSNIKEIKLIKNVFIQSANSKNSSGIMINLSSDSLKSFNIGNFTISDSNFFVKKHAISIVNVAISNGFEIVKTKMKSYQGVGIVSLRSSYVNSFAINDLISNSTLSIPVADSDNRGVKKFELSSSEIANVEFDLSEVGHKKAKINAIIDGNRLGSDSTSPIKFKAGQVKTLEGFSVSNNDFITSKGFPVFSPQGIINNSPFKGNRLSTSVGEKTEKRSLTNWPG